MSLPGHPGRRVDDAQPADRRVGLREPLREFARQRPVMGTCAGLIMLATELADEDPAAHGVRHARAAGLHGAAQRLRAADRFVHGAGAAGGSDRRDGPFPAVFIRAPRLVRLGPGWRSWRATTANRWPCARGACWVATVRTNHFQPDRPALAVKLEPAHIRDLPEPRPRWDPRYLRRAWRVCTCASARWPVAACAGRTAGRTSAQRSSAWSRLRR